LTCKQVSKALLDGDYAKLPWYKRMGLRMHVGMCIVCRGYNRNVMLMYDVVRRFLEREETTVPEADTSQLDTSARDRIKARLRDAMPR